MTHKTFVPRLPQSDLEYAILATKEFFQKAQNEHFFLTGCTSFFGKWLIESLLWANSLSSLNTTITVLSRAPELFLNAMPHLKDVKGLYFVKGDIASLANNHINSNNISYIIHAANLLNDRTTEWPQKHMETAVVGIKNIMELAKRCNCKGVLFTSSGGVYRNDFAPIRNGKAFLEGQNMAFDMLCEPYVYGITKRFIESYATAIGTASGIRTILARCFSFVGPYMPLHSSQALGNFICDVLAGQDVCIKGDGTPIRTYMYGADLVVWLLTLLFKGQHGVPYNVGSKEPISIKQAAEEIVSASELSLAVKILGQPIVGNAPDCYIPDVSRAENAFNLSCKFSFSESITRTLCWEKKQHNRI